MSKAIITVFSLICLMTSCAQNEEVTTIYLVRHAEKTINDSIVYDKDDPPLTDEGLKRAVKLRELFSQDDISAIFSTAYQRNIQTVEPLSKSKQLSIQHYEWDSWQPMINKIVNERAGKASIVCGHSNNLLPMIGHLGGKKPIDSLGHEEYDKIFKVQLRSDTTEVELIVY